MMPKKILILSTGVLMGVMIMTQWKSQQLVEHVASRDTRSDLTREMTILVSTNESLRQEIEALEEQKEVYASQANTQAQVLAEIQKMEMMTGLLAVQGNGVRLKIGAPLTLAEITDLLNEIFQLGTEAVSVNDVRLVNETAGLASFGGQLTLAGQLLNPPFEIKIIGDADLLMKALGQADSTLNRIKAQDQNVEIGLSAELIQMPKVK